MKTKQIIATKIETAFTEDPDKIALVVSNKEEQVNVILETFHAPAIAASIVLSSQGALKKIAPEKIKQGLAWNLESAMQILPEALDIKLLADGEILCINIGTGALYFRLTEVAQRTLKQPPFVVG